MYSDWQTKLEGEIPFRLLLTMFKLHPSCFRSWCMSFAHKWPDDYRGHVFLVIFHNFRSSEEHSHEKFHRLLSMCRWTPTLWDGWGLLCGDIEQRWCTALYLHLLRVLLSRVHRTELSEASRMLYYAAATALGSSPPWTSSKMSGNAPCPYLLHRLASLR